MTIVLAIIGITSFTIFGAYYARRYDRPDALIGLYVMFTGASQIIASKIATFDLFFVKVTAPAAVLIFAVTFLIQDVVNEKFGRKEAHRMVAIALIAQVALVLFLYIGTELPPAPFWKNQEAWNQVLGLVPRITVASWITFLVSENLDAILYAGIRQATKGRHLWIRNVFSSIISLGVDTVLFVWLAFSGQGFPLWSLMIGQFVCKYLVALIDIPFMYLSRAVLGKSHVQFLPQGPGTTVASK